MLNKNMLMLILKLNNFTEKCPPTKLAYTNFNIVVFSI